MTLIKNKSILTDFQKRSMRVVLQQMNIEARKLISELEVDVFDFQDDKQASGIMFHAERIENSKVDGLSVLEKICSNYSERISSAMSFRNPFDQMGKEAVSLAIWIAPDVFLQNVDDPWTIKNGTKSPIYIDGGAFTSWPDVMNLVCSFAQIEMQRAMGKFDLLIGGEVRGIALAVWLASMSFVGTGVARKAVKEYGTGKGVEGNIQRGEVCVIVEDLITDGGSKGPFIENLRNMGAIVNDVIVLFDRKQGGEKYLADKYGVQLHSLTDIKIHIEVGEKFGFITPKEAENIRSYLADPKKWNLDRDYGWPIEG